MDKRKLNICKSRDVEHRNALKNYGILKISYLKVAISKLAILLVFLEYSIGLPNVSGYRIILNQFVKVYYQRVGENLNGLSQFTRLRRLGSVIL